MVLAERNATRPTRLPGWAVLVAGTVFAVHLAMERAIRFSQRGLLMTTKTTRNRRVAVVTKNDLLDLLNDDFARACRSIYAHAVYVERLRQSNPKVAAAIEECGRQEVLAALTLCELIYDYGGAVKPPGDELNFVLNADRVADPMWAAETVRRLRQRVSQLRTAGEPGLAKRLHRIAAVKRSAPSLAKLLASVEPPG